MSDSVRAAACLERSASERTSSATTAKLRPASPARAASTAALRARRLVWKAMSLMSLMIWEVPSVEVRMAAIAASIRVIDWRPLRRGLARAADRGVRLLRLVRGAAQHRRDQLDRGGVLGERRGLLGGAARDRLARAGDLHGRARDLLHDRGDLQHRVLERPGAWR